MACRAVGASIFLWAVGTTAPHALAINPRSTPARPPLRAHALRAIAAPHYHRPRGAASTADARWHPDIPAGAAPEAAPNRIQVAYPSPCQNFADNGRNSRYLAAPLIESDLLMYRPGGRADRCNRWRPFARRGRGQSRVWGRGAGRRVWGRPARRGRAASAAGTRA